MVPMMARRWIVLSCLLVVFVGGCSGGSQSPKCVTGITVECPCPAGQQGAQTCTSAGTFAACVCATPTVDAGGGASSDGAITSPPDSAISLPDATAVGGSGGSAGMGGGAGGPVVDAVPDQSADDATGAGPDVPVGGGGGGAGGISDGGSAGGDTTRTASIDAAVAGAGGSPGTDAEVGGSDTGGGDSGDGPPSLDGRPTPDVPIVLGQCGNGKIESGEQCDDGNTLPNDGCSPTCHFEPNCRPATGTCTSKCGDGLVVNEECDDGNTTNGDGCSSTCTVEPGFQCAQPDSTADTMTVSVTYRDFLVGGDFHKDDIAGANGAVTGLVQGTLDSEGKPVYVGVGGTGATSGWVTSAASFHNWYRDTPGTNTTYVSTILLHNNGNGGFVNWWKDNQEWTAYPNARWCSDATCTNCSAPAYVNDGTMHCFASCTPWGTGSGPCVADQALVPGNPLFFPLDNIPGMITPTSAYAPGETPPMYSGTWTWEPGTPQPLHNFSFTSEVRYWFSYSTNRQYTLDFASEDDLWVFVNRKLAVDLGGLHTPVVGRLVLDATGGGTVTVTPTAGAACKTEGVVSTCTSTTSTVSLGLLNGGVYEIAVFHAQRGWYGSTYKITLIGFNALPSACLPI